MFYMIDLNEHMNHKMIFTDDEFNECNVLFDDFGLSMDCHRHFCQKSFFVNKTFSCGEVCFKSPPVDVKKYDNISCNGQKIQLRAEAYHTVHYIGYCDVGRFREPVTFYRQDITAGNSDLFFYDWGIKGNTIREYDIKNDSCRIAFTDEKEYEKDYLFIYSTPIDALTKEPLFDALLLPQNPFMHIFAITLEV